MIFEHVQRQSIAFFTRTQTGALISRLNSDVIGAQQAFTSTLSGVISNVLSLILVTITKGTFTNPFFNLFCKGLLEDANGAR